MIDFVSGIVLDIDPNSNYLLLDIGSIAFGIYTSDVLLVEPGQSLRLHTMLLVSDTALTLYGFILREHLDQFKLLLKVKGVGAKTAVQILKDVADLSVVSIPELINVKGVGVKTASAIYSKLR